MKDIFKKAGTNFSINPIIAIVILALLYHTSTYNYLLFHSLAEFFSIVIGCIVFVIGWHSRYYIQNNYLLYISICYLFVAFIDLLHTLSYPGMNIFTDYDYYANQLWIAARYIEALVLLTGFYFINDKRRVNHNAVLGIMAFITFLVVMSVFVWKIFPVCFIGGEGLTPFKKYSEYIICLILLCSAFLLYRNRHRFTDRVYRYMFYTIIYTILAELAFTFYISNYGISNLMGHYFKLFSFYCIYVSIIVTGLEYPHQTIFKELVDKEKELTEATKTKDQLYSIFMHDIRGPINTLHHFLHDAKNNIEQYSKDEMAAFAEAGHRSVSGLNTLVNNLHTWIKSQGTNIKPRYSEISINDLIYESIEPVQRTAESKNIAVSVSTLNDIILNTDKDIMKTVLRNIIGNSIKFTKNGGIITINARQSEESVIITVRDNGIGISREILDNIFDVKKQFTSKGTEGEQGSGLGLRICYDLLRKMNGSINIDSEKGTGTTVTIVLSK